MKREIPAQIRRLLEARDAPPGQAADRGGGVRLRAFLVGAALSFFLAVGAPYAMLLVKGPYLAQNATASGAFLLLLFLVGILNALFKLGARSSSAALTLALLALALFLLAFRTPGDLDPNSPHLTFSVIFVFLLFLNAALVWHGHSLALNRAELVLVYLMLLVVSAVATLGLGTILLPAVTGLFYYASPENGWMERLVPHLPGHAVLVDDGHRNTSFYEGLAPGQEAPWAAWVEPLFWWTIFLGALYLSVISAAVILRRQWVENERLPYPVAQVPLALVQGEEEGAIVNRFFKNPWMWLGCALPLVIGSLRAWHAYDPAVVRPRVFWMLPLFDVERLVLQISFLWIGFCYFINTKIVAGMWIFHLLFKLEGWGLAALGLHALPGGSAAGFRAAPLLAYQGSGAFIALVLAGLWMGRRHLRGVARKALGRAPEMDDGGEILSYRAALAGVVAGPSIMAGWLWLMGVPAWIAVLFVALQLLILTGISRYVAEAGMVRTAAPIAAPGLVIHSLGPGLIGPTGVISLALSSSWSLNNTINLMTLLSNGLRLVGEMDRRSRRCVRAAVLLALALGIAGAFWTILHLAFKYGGINLHNSYFGRYPRSIFNLAAASLDPGGVYWPGLGFFAGGAIAMLLMIWARLRYAWWPIHPLGFPVGMVMHYFWLSMVAAWLIKTLVLRYGGAAVYRRTQPFFLGLIAGHVLCTGSWIVVDSFTGMTGNITWQM